MSALLLFLIQLLQGAGVPVDMRQGTVVFGAPTHQPAATHVRAGGRTHREAGDGDAVVPTPERFDDSCEISNGF